MAERRVTRASLWAMPSSDDAAPFAEWIDRLAARVGAAPFAPHITLVGDVPDASDGAIGRVLDPQPPFAVTFVGLADSDARFRCITVTAAAEPPLVELHAALVAACGDDGAPFEPHLSLLYAELPAAERASLRASVDLDLPRTITVDAVGLVDTSDEASRWSNLRTWRL